jgi:nicotinate phosphoribosyltransferase
MIIRSLLDTDLYKLTMQQAILFGRFAGVHFQSVPVRYKFINRNRTPFPAGFDRMLQAEIESLARLQLVEREREFLTSRRFLKPGYIDFFSGYRYNPEEVTVTQDSDGQLHVTVEGPWYRTVMWEVPLLAIISELYFQSQNITVSLPSVRDSAAAKAMRLVQAGCFFADFGTRRRYSREVHEHVVEGLKFCPNPHSHFSYRRGNLTGASNVWLAMRNNITPIGTHAHEWFQAIAALFGYRQANRFALEAWAEEYGGDLGIALSDTFTTDVFFHDFRADMAKLWDGVRHDSGDPLVFAQKTIDHYQSLHIDPLSKTIVFSDGLNVDKAIELNEWCKGKIKCAFGIGTHFSNDVGATPLNIVMKMTRCNGMPAVKLSDVDGKNTGDADAIESCKFQLGLNA